MNEFDLTGEFWSPRDIGNWAKKHKTEIALTALSFVPVAGQAGWALKGAMTAYKGITAARKAKAGVSAAKAVIKNGNNVMRIGKGRISIGPDKTHYLNGKLGHRIPFHIHLEKAKAGINFHKTGGCKRLWGKWRC